MKYFSTIVCFIFLINLSLAQEKVSDQEIIKLIQLSGAYENYQLRRDSLLEVNQKPYLQNQDSFLQSKYEQEIKKNSLLELNSGYIEIYKKHFSKNEVLALIKFYESDLGELLSKKASIIRKESIILEDRIDKEIKTNIENKKLFEVSISADCSIFREGNFIYGSSLEEKETTITRDSEYQVERIYGIDTKLKIEWVSNNKYKLYQNLEDANKKHLIIVESNIYEVSGNTYKYISKSNLSNKYSRGVIMKIE